MRHPPSSCAPIAKPSPPTRTFCRRPSKSQALLSAYLLEKALYELLYELNNRPAWLHIPLAGILAL